MIDVFTDIANIAYKKNDAVRVTDEVLEYLKNNGYEISEVNNTKPWGSYIRINDEQVDRFIQEFFNNVAYNETRRHDADVKLSPKILIVSSAKRLSLQTHNRRAERWKFITSGSYFRGETLDTTKRSEASPGEEVQFRQGEIHRLCGADSNFTVVAEIWQHTDLNNPSDEDDITRLEDDYSRVL